MSKGNKSGTAQPVQPKTATADTNNVVAPNNPEVKAAETEDSESAPQATEDLEADRKDGAVENVDASEFTSPVIDQAVEIETTAEQMELPNAPQANMPQATEVPVSDNGMMKLLNRHGQPVELPEKTALFLLKRYPRWYTQIN